MRHENMQAWSPDEDRIILDMFATSGRKWGKIAAELSSRPNGGFRTSASVRNRYLRIEKGQQMRAEGKSKNRCAACGQQKLGHVCQVRLNAVRKVVATPPTAARPPAAAEGAVVPIAPTMFSDAAETLAALSGGATMLVAQVTENDTVVAQAWPEPRKRVAWRKHEEEAAARMSSKPSAEAQALPAKAEYRAGEAEYREGKAEESKLRGSVVVLTKQPSGEVIMSSLSMYTMADQTGQATAHASDELYR